MKSFIPGVLLALCAVLPNAGQAATVHLTPSFADINAPYATPEALALVTRQGQRAQDLSFSVETQVSDSALGAATGSGGLSHGDPVTFSATYLLSPSGNGQHHPFMKVGAAGAGNTGIGYFDNAFFDTDTAVLSLVNSAAGHTAYAIDGSACGLGAGSTLLDLADAANSGCVTFSGGMLDYTSFSMAGGTVSAQYSLQAVPLPAAGLAYGLALCLGAGFLARRRNGPGRRV